ncbi:hypothetical protein [Phytopseudomonas punonensis]|uniref:Uncharacterized protein n=1 Tax=Phytopseudomonas punonensis TaxID=1220495 RepID=A0A1M7MER1_9GAMM|nr:hypothetical protein [Pseudomonas punonensis]SHM89266.1 hypothetical protein SAMN05216288_4572 [Pseudomonas punonensis]
MNKITGSALLLAALFSAGVQADDDGMSLQQQRDKIGDEMVRERTGTPPADMNGTGQSTTDQQQQPLQQTPRSTLNSPARQNGTGNESGTDNRRQPSNNAPATGNQTAPSTQGSSTAPATPGTGGGSQGVGGAISQ